MEFFTTEYKLTGGAKYSAATKKHYFLAALGALIVFLFVLLVAAVMFPAPIVRCVFSRIEAQSGIALTFDKVYFYLQDGAFLSIEGLALKRKNHHASNFDLRIDNVRMPAMMPHDFSSPVLLVSGLSGTYERIGNDPEVGGGGIGGGKRGGGNTYIHALLLLDSEVDFVDRTLEKPFRGTIQVKECSIFKTSSPSLLEPYTFSAHGQIGSAKFTTDFTKGAAIEDYGGLQMEITEIPLGFFAPYAPVLDDIFDSGNMNITIDDLTDETQKRIRVAVILLPDCRIKSADKIVAPAIQAALQTLDQSALNELSDLKGKIERLKTVSESWYTELEGVSRIIDTLSVLAPRDVREKYDKFKNQYDRARAIYSEWDILTKSFDRLKIRIVEDTFQQFIASGVPIKIDIQEVNGTWQFDAYETVVHLVENNYRTILATEYQGRIQEIRNTVDRLLMP